MPVCVVRFPGTPREYDYLCPFEVKPGNLVVVDTARGEATVEVVAVKESSLAATKSIVRLAEKERDY